MTVSRPTPLAQPRAAAESRVIFDVVGDPPTPPVIRPPAAEIKGRHRHVPEGDLGPVPRPYCSMDLSRL